MKPTAMPLGDRSREGVEKLPATVRALGAASEQFLLLRVADLGLPQALVPLVWFAMSLAKSGAAARAGRLADGVAPRLVLGAGWLLFAAGVTGAG